MADARKIVIEIKQVNSDDTPKTPSEAQSGQSEEKASVQSILHPSKSVERSTVGKSVLVSYAFSQASQSIKSAISLSVSRYFALKEDYLGETALKNALTAVNKTVSFGTSVLGGAAAGSLIGPVGTAAGAMIGAIGWATNEVISGVQTYNASMLEIGTSAYQSAFANERYGLINGGRGTEN